MLIGKELGPYVVEKELGSGAMGTVFRARHKSSGEHVAIKLMSIALGTNEVAVARFVREVAILKQLDHPNIVKYKGSGRYHKSPFYIMEYVEGESLDHVFARRGRLTWEEIVEIGVPLCAALQHAHDKGIIHRDLKPSNLMMLKGGGVKLTDFGIAKDVDVTALTGVNSTVGTAAYMSPEQCRGAKDISFKTDLYSMGILFYELVAGRKPFTGETAMEIFLQHANKKDFARPAQWVMDVPVWLDSLIIQLMEKTPDKRPFSATAVAEALKSIKEKVDAQKSAGIEAATRRRIDRTSTEKKLDEDDKEAARTMLGRKKKKKEQPYYTQGWFTVTALAGLLIAVAGVLYFAVFKTPSADSLYASAESLMKSADEAQHKEARQGPIADFLRYYSDHEKSKQVRDWADDVDFAVLNRQLHNRRKGNWKVGGEDAKEEQLARDALDAEDVGKLMDATRYWDELGKRKESTNPILHAWGLVGERYGLELKKVSELYDALKSKTRTDGEGTDELEKAALAALKKELAKEDTAAINRWETLAQDTRNKDDRRRWHLLAMSRLQELRNPLGKN